VRPANQDAYGYSAEAQCFAVCDGMGGAAGGEVASRVAVETFLERLGPELPADSAPVSTGRRIEQAVAAANRILYTRAQREHALHGMGTTLVALVLSEPVLRAPVLSQPASSEPAKDGDKEQARPRAGRVGRPIKARPDRGAREGGVALRASAGGSGGVRAGARAWIAHVGDSRCYLLRAGALRRCTRDHSLVEEQVRLGQMTPAEAAASPMRHVITRAVGVRRSVAVEVQELEIEPGDLFLLCSDGLTRDLDEMRIAELLAELSGRAGDGGLAEALVREALAAGGGDNITCLTVYMA
jgi:protein phosphatase